jgi:hypothetical protein
MFSVIRGSQYKEALDLSRIMMESPEKRNGEKQKQEKKGW